MGRKAIRRRLWSWQLDEPFQLDDSSINPLTPGLLRGTDMKVSECIKVREDGLFGFIMNLKDSTIFTAPAKTIDLLKSILDRNEKTSGNNTRIFWKRWQLTATQMGFDMENKNMILPQVPFRVEIEVTGMCNLACPNCYAQPLSHYEPPLVDVRYMLQKTKQEVDPSGNPLRRRAIHTQRRTRRD